MKKPFSFLVICILFISISFVRLSDQNWGKNNNYGVLAWDNFGYYLYLPATFIYDDLKIENLEWVNNIRKKYQPSSSFYQAHYIEGGTHVIQYSMGMAVIYMPAFWAGHLYALASDSYPADGFSTPYQLSVLLYSLLIVALGLYFLRKLALLYFSDKIAAFAIVILCFGSNYFQLASTNTSSPHSILFSFYAILLYLVYKWHLKPSLRFSALFALLFGIMVLARPNELVFCLIPIFWGVSSWSSFKNKLEFFLKNFKHLLLMLCIMACIGSLQMLYWKLTSNHWLFDSYTNEDFKFLSPYLSEYLFSYKKGWILYSPIFFLLIFGYYQLFKKSSQLAVPLLLHFIITVWVLSSWDNWWYADSFSQRSIVQCYPVFIFPFAYLIEFLLKQKNILKLASFGLLAAIIGLNLFQTYQVRAGIIHTQRMTKDYYWEVFGKTKRSESAFHLLEPERGVNFIPKNLNYSKTLLIQQDAGRNLSLNSPYSKKWCFAATDITEKGFLYLNIGVGYQIEHVENASLGVVFQALDLKSKKRYSYAYEFEHIPKLDSTYQTLSAVYAPTYLRSLSDTIEVYLWLNGNASINVEQLTIEVLNPQLEIANESDFLFGAAEPSKYWTEPYIDSNKKNSYYQIDSIHQYSATLEKLVSDIDFKSGKFQLSVNGLHTSESQEVYAVVNLAEGDKNLYYRAFRIPNKTNTWDTWTFNGEISESILDKSTFKFYLWNKSKDPFYYKNISLQFK